MPEPWKQPTASASRARLDAVFFHLYGLDRDDADYVLGTFPIVAREETARYGTFRSRALILATMAALAAGNPDASSCNILSVNCLPASGLRGRP